MEYWNQMGEPQAIVISGLLTVIAALIGVLVGAKLFRGQVATLKDALDESEKMISDHRGFVGQSLADVKDQLSSMMESLGQLRGSVGELQVSTPSETLEATMPIQDIDLRENLRSMWIEIRDQLEKIAADPEIDGRTRAKYARIDRRNYLELINTLALDNRLGGQPEIYREAANLWAQFKNGRRVPSRSQLEQMSVLKARITGAQ